MQIVDLIRGVQDIIKRPDLASMIDTRVRGAVKWVHMTDFYPRDRITAVQNIKPNQVVRLTLPERFRQFELIRPLTDAEQPIPLSTDTVDTIGLIEADPHQLLDYRNVQRDNYYYVVGDIINIKMNCTADKMLFMYYAYPDLRDDKATTWVTEQFPELIIFRAAAVLYAQLGNQDLRNTYGALSTEHLEQLKDISFQTGGAQ